MKPLFKKGFTTDPTDETCLIYFQYNDKDMFFNSFDSLIRRKYIYKK